MPNRRELLASLAAGVALRPRLDGRESEALLSNATQQTSAPPLRRRDGTVDWMAVRALFPLTRDWTHLAAFLFVSHPRPVAESIDHFRRKLDSDVTWLEAAAYSDAEGRPWAAVKDSLAKFAGGKPEELCITQNTTTGLALLYHGLRIRADQEILTTVHDHYSHHSSIQYAAARSGVKVRYVSMFEDSSRANASKIVDSISRAITPKTRAVGVTWVHSGTGVKIPLEPIAAAVARANRGRWQADRCLLIVDGVHGFANQDVDVANLGADFFAAGTHKWLCGPRGTGFVWGKAEVWPEIRPTIPSFDPDGLETWDAWMNHTPLPSIKASFVSPGGFQAYEHILAIPSAIQLHRTIGRDKIASRIAELNAAFREGVARMPKVKLHTPRDASLSGGLSCFEVSGLTAEQVTQKLADKKIRTNSTPYKVPFARVSAGMMNQPEEITKVLAAIRAL